MEGLAPPPFVDVGYEVVEGVYECGDFIRDFDLLRAVEEGPILLVIIFEGVAVDGASGEIDGVLAFLFGGVEDVDEPVEAVGEEGGGAN